MSIVESSLALLGKRGKDAVSQHEGVVDSIAFDLYGCVIAGLKPTVDKDGKQRESVWFDIKRVVITDERQVIKAPDFFGVEKGKETGSAEHPVR